MGFSNKITEAVAVPSPQESSQPKDQTHISYVACTGSWDLYHCCHLRSEVYHTSKNFCVWRKAEKNMVGGTNFGSDYLDYLNETLHCSMLFLENENWFNLILSKPSKRFNPCENTRMFLLLLTWILRHLIIYLLNSKYDLISKEFHIPCHQYRNSKTSSFKITPSPFFLFIPWAWEVLLYTSAKLAKIWPRRQND